MFDSATHRYHRSELGRGGGGLRPWRVCGLEVQVRQDRPRRAGMGARVMESGAEDG
jgi:hypothetical protein